MKKIIIFFILLIPVCFSCSGGQEIEGVREGMSEDKAIDNIANEIYNKKNLLRTKKISIFNFSNLEGKEIEEGKRLSKKLLSILVNKGDLLFVERSEIDSILKAQGIEQSGIVESGSLETTGKILPIDVMIHGTLAQVNGRGELTVKAVNIKTGQIYYISTTEFLPKERFSYKENPEKLRLHKRDPKKLELMNKTFNALSYLSNKSPMIFLIATVERSDRRVIIKHNMKLGRKLLKLKNRIQRTRPADWRKIMRLRRGTTLLKRYSKSRYEKIKLQKMELIKKK